MHFESLFLLGVDDIIQFLVIAFVIISAIAGFIKNLFEGQNQKPPAERPIREALPEQGAEKALDDEIREFLRQTMHGNQAEEDRHEEPPVEAAVVPATQVKRPLQRGESVQEHVQQHMDTSVFEERSSHLGEKVSSADEKTEKRLREKYDRELSCLHGATDRQESVISEGTDDAVWQPMQDPKSRRAIEAGERLDRISDLLQNPQSIRQAIILNEVLRPVDFEW